MAETRLTNAQIDPSVFTEYTLGPSIYRSRFYNSGIIQRNTALDSFLNGNGDTISLPYWDDVSGTSGDIPVEGSDQTVNAIVAKKQIALKQYRTKAWGTNNLVTVATGSNPLDAAAQRVVDYWGQAYDIMAIKSLEGVVADNVANDSSDLVFDITGAATKTFNDSAVIDAQALLGENGTLGRPDQDAFVAILVHPSTYALMRKNDLIDFVPISDQDRPVEFYMNMRVIVDRNATVVAADTPDSYYSYIFKPGFMQFGLGSQGYLPTETERKVLDGFGIDQLVTRRVFAMHPFGMQWVDGSVAGVSPTDAELALAANWDRAQVAENMRFVALKHQV